MSWWIVVCAVCFLIGAFFGTLDAMTSSKYGDNGTIVLKISMIVFLVILCIKLGTLL